MGWSVAFNSAGPCALLIWNYVGFSGGGCRQATTRPSFRDQHNDGFWRHFLAVEKARFLMLGAVPSVLDICIRHNAESGLNETTSAIPVGFPPWYGIAPRIHETRTIVCFVAESSSQDASLLSIFCSSFNGFVTGGTGCPRD